jgi:hypothetical protein
MEPPLQHPIHHEPGLTGRNAFIVIFIKPQLVWPGGIVRDAENFVSEGIPDPHLIPHRGRVFDEISLRKMAKGLMRENTRHAGIQNHSILPGLDGLSL